MSHQQKDNKNWKLAYYRDAMSGQILSRMESHAIKAEAANKRQ